jgi:hypothetical protein
MVCGGASTLAAAPQKSDRRYTLHAGQQNAKHVHLNCRNGGAGSRDVDQIQYCKSVPLERCAFFCLLPLLTRSPNRLPAPSPNKEQNSMCDRCRVASHLPSWPAAARVRDACTHASCESFLSLGEGEKKPLGAAPQPCRLDWLGANEQEVARLGRPVRAGWRG